MPTLKARRFNLRNMRAIACNCSSLNTLMYCEPSRTTNTARYKTHPKTHRVHPSRPKKAARKDARDPGLELRRRFSGLFHCYTCAHTSPLPALKCLYQFNERKSPLLNEPSDFAWFEPRARMTSKAFRYEPHRQNQLTQSHGRE